MPDYYDLWRSNVNGEGVEVTPTQTQVLQTLATNLPEGDLPARATADLFPAYDDDGGMLLVLTPEK